MSVLLDALKKSEEEKKKSEAEGAASPEAAADAASPTESGAESKPGSQSAPPEAAAAPAPAPGPAAPKPAAGGGIGRLGMFSHSAPIPKPHVTRRPAGPPGVKPPGAAAPGMAPPPSAAGKAPPPSAAGVAPPPSAPMSVASKPKPGEADVAGDLKPVSPAPSLAKPTDAGAGKTFDFDSIEDPTSSKGKAGLPAGSSRRVESRAVAGSVVGAGESAVDAVGQGSVAASSGRSAKLALAAAVLVAVGGGAYYLLLSGPAPAPVAVQPQQGSVAQGEQQAADPADLLPLPNPNIDIQSELVNFASYTSDSARVEAAQGVAERLAVLTSSFLEQDEAAGEFESADAAGEASGTEVDLELAEPTEAEAAESVVADPETFPLADGSASQESLARKRADVDLGSAVRLYAVAPEQVPESMPGEPAETERTNASAPVASITLETSEKADVIRRLLDEAKREFDAGNLAAAEVAFRKILADDLNNVNAMKGLAMVASETGRYRLAASVYLKVLDLQPDDVVAISELISLHSRQSDYKLTERKLKSLVGRIPAHDDRLYFALGNLYAELGRWYDAQQNYFNAYSADSNNPDYAFNLAVSLEYVGRQDIALDYYKVAQDLAKTGAYSFEDSVLTTRILQLDN